VKEISCDFRQLFDFLELSRAFKFLTVNPEFVAKQRIISSFLVLIKIVPVEAI
jgi:hypothetical protein